jgi:hypothetical protein
MKTLHLWMKENSGIKIPEDVVKQPYSIGVDPAQGKDEHHVTIKEVFNKFEYQHPRTETGEFKPINSVIG